MATAMKDEILWRHPAPEQTDMYKFMQEINRREKLNLKTFEDLHQYSITNISNFWVAAFRYINLVHEGKYTRVVDETAPIDSVPEWFQGIYLNFAENLLYSGPVGSDPADHSTIGKEDNKIAITEVTEADSNPVHITWRRVREEVMQMALAMKAHGVRKGDRVAVVTGNSFNTLKVFLGVTALGGIFSSSSPDMGVKGVLDRLVQLKPKLVFCDDAARYNGKTIDLRNKIKDLIPGLAEVQEFQSVVVIPRFSANALRISHIPRCQTLAAFLGEPPNPQAVAAFKFERVAFKDPFLIVYSSGTTGMPKCIAHSTGGVLLSSAVHNQLHVDQNSTDTVLQFTTTGWIMYLLHAVHMIHGARLILYDGSPFYPDMTAYIRLMSREKVTMLGTSPKWLGEMQKRGICPRDVADLSPLRVVSSTGSVLSEQLFRWVYEKGFPSTVHLENVSGGTDIAGAFACGNPLTPVSNGGMQGPPLGIALSVFEEDDRVGVKGNPTPAGTPGELVVTRAFPNMPTSFWGSDGKKKYFESYFAKFNHVWTQGDNVFILPGTLRINFIGRSDGVLNPAGIRYGSVELYSIIEQRFPQVADSIAVGQKRPQDEEERVVLFLMMSPGERFTPELCADVKGAIRKALSPRHVPAFIFETPEIPTTVNLKKVELPVKKILSGMIVQPSSTLANPSSLDHFYKFVNIEEAVKTKSRL
ncbi:acetoacetyl-CoA synthase [Acephala macrosclerotiorum]|nr:acetoacetyl-CoA synthase [Acephala macrosclerotiorum]